MTFPITDDQVERAARAMGHAFPNPDEHCRKYVRSILEAALDRRKGERDRRKVRDGKLRYYGFEGDERRVTSIGRRSSDKLCWQNLPLSEPPIQVSLKMRSAVMKAIQRGFESFRCRDSLGAAADEIAQAVLRVEIEEARRIEEQKAQGAPYGAVYSGFKDSLTTVHGNTVAVGFPVNRDDGLISLHVGSTQVLLDNDEREALVRALQQPSAPTREHTSKAYCRKNWHGWAEIYVPDQRSGMDRRLRPTDKLNEDGVLFCHIPERRGHDRRKGGK